MDDRFPHERLLVFRKAVEFVAWTEQLSRRPRPGSLHLLDQLHRPSR